MSLMPKQKGTQDAFFRQLVDEHGERIYNLALMKSGHQKLAEDISQETFIRVYKGLDKFQNNSQLGTWIYRIAINVCHTILQKESKKWGKVLLSTDSAMLIAEDANIEDDYLEQARKQTIQKAISRLPPQQSDAITLYYLKEFQYSEVAEIMDIPINTLKSHLRRAKERLRELIQESDV